MAVSLERRTSLRGKAEPMQPDAKSIAQQQKLPLDGVVRECIDVAWSSWLKSGIESFAEDDAGQEAERSDALRFLRRLPARFQYCWITFN